MKTAGLRLHRGADLHVSDEVGDRDAFPPFESLASRRNVGERAVHEIAQADQVRPEQEARAAGYRNTAALDAFKRQHGRIQQVAELVGQDAQALCSLICDCTFALTSEFGHRPLDRIVEAEIECPKLLPGNWRHQLNGQLSDDLTDISVVVNHLRDGEPHAERVATVLRGARYSVRT